jgi:acetyl-CoA carboxylase biotin carboxyl carrier protein
MFSPDEVEKTRQLLELFGDNKLSELSVSESGGYAVEIKAALYQPSTPVPMASPPPAKHVRHMSQQSAAATIASQQKAGHKTLNSPMVGIFYSSPSPGDPPFVNIGDVITVGQTIGLIEAMKVFSEIPAEAAGKIVETVAISGTLVQQSEPLFRIEPV